MRGVFLALLLTFHPFHGIVQQHLVGNGILIEAGDDRAGLIERRGGDLRARPPGMTRPPLCYERN